MNNIKLQRYLHTIRICTYTPLIYKQTDAVLHREAPACCTLKFSLRAPTCNPIQLSNPGQPPTGDIAGENTRHQLTCKKSDALFTFHVALSFKSIGGK